MVVFVVSQAREREREREREYELVLFIFCSMGVQSGRAQSCKARARVVSITRDCRILEKILSA